MWLLSADLGDTGAVRGGLGGSRPLSARSGKVRDGPAAVPATLPNACFVGSAG